MPSWLYLNNDSETHDDFQQLSIGPDPSAFWAGSRPYECPISRAQYVFPYFVSSSSLYGSSIYWYVEGMRLDVGIDRVVIFPFINQMISELGVTDNPDKVGFYSGLVVCTLWLNDLEWWLMK